MSDTRQRKPENTVKLKESTRFQIAKPTAKLQSVLSSSVKGASHLIVLQLLSRLLTFVLHQIVLRFTNPKTFGIAAVQLELLLNTILFLSREGFRCALLRGGGISSNYTNEEDVELSKNALDSRNYVVANSKKGSIQKITNLAYVPIPFGMVTTFAACLFCIYSVSEETYNSPHYAVSVTLYGVAAFMELIIEPLFITATNNLIFTLRVRSEGIGVVLRCIITLFLTILGAPQTDDQTSENAYGILAFAIAQLAYSLVLLIGYCGYFYLYWDIKELLPRPLQIIQDGRQKLVWFDAQLSSLAKTFTWQSLLKHVLTEGDKMLIAWLSTPNDQGVYAFVVNYGSLIARILFQPLEETGRTLFSKLLSGIEVENNVSRAAKDQDDSQDEAQRTVLLTSLQILTTIIKFHVLLGLLFISFGSNYTGALIDILVGSKWSIGTPAPLALSFYCFFVPIMGVNGITEAFVTAVGTQETISQLNQWLVAFSIGFVSAGFFFVRVLSAGAIGLVAANAFNLLIRIAWSWRYIRHYFLNMGNKYHQTRFNDEIRQLLTIANMSPSLLVWLSFAIAWMVTYWSNQVIGWGTLEAKIRHISVGFFTAIAVASTIYLQEKKFMKDVAKLIGGRKLE
ncbi:hypothetical protein G9A89_013197 [Geosiphon pyriformis]|nr:hypothetical protein G9A89_013197 [Geosiphon pyriformis]